MASTRITVNGGHYDGVEAMPPEVRQIYEQAMQAVAAGSGSTVVKTNEVNLSFELRGPGFKFRAGSAEPPHATSPGKDALLRDAAPTRPDAIEPSSGALRAMLLVAIAAAACGALWLWKLR